MIIIPEVECKSKVAKLFRSLTCNIILLYGTYRRVGIKTRTITKVRRCFTAPQFDDSLKRYNRTKFSLLKGILKYKMTSYNAV